MNRAEAVHSRLANFIGAYQLARGCKPEQVTVSAKDYQLLCSTHPVTGESQAPHTYMGVKLKVEG